MILFSSPPGPRSFGRATPATAPMWSRTDGSRSPWTTIGYRRRSRPAARARSSARWRSSTAARAPPRPPRSRMPGCLSSPRTGCRTGWRAPIPCCAWCSTCWRAGCAQPWRCWPGRTAGTRNPMAAASQLQNRGIQDIRLEQDLVRALSNGDFQLHYQPIVDLASRKAVGFEALSRWLHPVRGMLPPQEFIPRAEASGLITALTRWALPRALDELETLIADLPPGALELPYVAVNVSVADLQDPTFPGVPRRNPGGPAVRQGAAQDRGDREPDACRSRTGAADRSTCAGPWGSASRSTISAPAIPASAPFTCCRSAR